jgi:hypothetical protein
MKNRFVSRRHDLKRLKHLTTVIFSAILFSVSVANAQIDVVTSKPIEVFHGTTTYVEYDGIKRVSPFEVLSREGSNLTIQIKNPNYLLYQYSSIVKEVQVKDDLPDVTEFLAALNNLQVPSNSLFSNYSSRASALCLSDLTAYFGAIQTLQADINVAKKAISDSDDDSQSLNFYLKKIKDLSNAKNNFNDDKLEENLLFALNSAFKPTGRAISLTAEQELILDALQTQARGLAKIVNDIKGTLITKQSFVYKYKTGKKAYTISIVAKPLNGFKPLRTVDTIAQILVRPYVRSSWEIIPTLNFVYASGGKEFKVENGLITENAMDQVTPRYGAFLIRNIWNWGEYKEVRCGIGVGFSLRAAKDQQVLENLQAGFFTNIQDFLKIGVGVGWAQLPTGLNKAGVGLPLPGDVSSVEEITSYSRNPAAFLSITIFGFKFPKK